MRKALMVLGIALALSPASFTQTKLGTPADEAAILKNRDAQNAAYNTHDGKAYALVPEMTAPRAWACSRARASAVPFHARR